MKCPPFSSQINCFLVYSAFLTLEIDFRDDFGHFLIDFRASNSKIAFEILKNLIFETSDS